MPNDYNVDDILTEIKNRKKQRAGIAAEEAAPPAQAPPELEEPSFAAPPPGKKPTRPAPPQEPERTRRKEPSGPKNPISRESLPQEPPVPSETAPPRRQPPRPPETIETFSFGEPERPKRAQAQRTPEVPLEPLDPTELTSHPSGRPSNPMEFTGHVRPLTDKARMRPKKLNTPPRDSQPSFQFKQMDEQDTGGIPDFSSFGEEGGDAPVPRGTSASEPTRDHTRVLPKFSTGKDINPDELPRRLGMLGGAGSTYYEEDEEDDLPAERTSVDFSEYNSVEDRRDVATDIARVKLWLFIRMTASAVLTVLLFYLCFAGRYVIPLPAAIEPTLGDPDSIRAYLLTCTGITVALGLVNSSAVGGGILSLFKMRANSDTLASLALMASVAQGVVGITNPAAVDPTNLSMYFSVAALSMFLGTVGKMLMIGRIQQNFRIIASDKKKKALLSVEDEDFCHEFVPDALRRPTITYSVRANFFTDFLGLSYSDKYDVGINRSVAPVCLVGALLVGIVSYLLTWEALTAVSALTAILCVSATFSATFIENVPLNKLARKLAPQGGMVSGNKAVEDFCDTRAVILNETDFFPEGNVRLRGIRSFAQGGRIDEAILDAASVICSLDGALKPVFMQMIGGNRSLLKKVDNVVYESGMGVSAWVNQRRVLIGTRKLMDNHGIAVPPESKLGQVRTPEDGEIIYLSNSGEVSALFMVSYHIDEDLAAQLDLLAARDTVLLVHTNDANITPHRLWELYGYPEELITVLPADRHETYKEMCRPRETAIAEIVYTGRASTMVAAILACFNARSSILSATIIQLIQIVLGYGIVAFLAFMGAIGSLTISQLCIYQLFWFLAICIVQKTKQP